MYAMVLKKIGAALEWTEHADPQPGPGEIRVKVSACGVCRTDVHVVDGELIHMSDIPSFPYQRLWEKRQLVSVANLTRQDRIDFLQSASRMIIVTKTTIHPLNQANQALADLRAGRFEGEAVLVP